MKKKSIIAFILASIMTTCPVGSKENNVSQEKIEQDLENAQIAYEELVKEKEVIPEDPDFIKYNLSEEQLIQIARLCQQEQRTLEGSAAEASLMANRYELHGQEYSDIYNYIKNSGWFAKASYYMNYGKLNSEILELVRTVLIEGKRILPKYVDEHDYIHDISFITTGDKFSKADYIPFETMVYNCYSADYGFYGFMGTDDVFGYTSNELREKLGEEHYEFERLLER